MRAGLLGLALHAGSLVLLGREWDLSPVRWVSVFSLALGIAAVLTYAAPVVARRRGGLAGIGEVVLVAGAGGTFALLLGWAAAASH